MGGYPFKNQTFYFIYFRSAFKYLIQNKKQLLKRVLTLIKSYIFITYFSQFMKKKPSGKGIISLFFIYSVNHAKRSFFLFFCFFYFPYLFVCGNLVFLLIFITEIFNLVDGVGIRVEHAHCLLSARVIEHAITRLQVLFTLELELLDLNLIIILFLIF